MAERAGAVPFLYPGWLRAWRAAFGVRAPRVVTARRDGLLVGLLPMQLRGGALHAPTNVHTPVFDLLAVDGEAAQAVAHGLFATGVHEIAVGPLDADAEGLRILRAAAREAGYRVLLRPVAHPPHLRLGGDLKTYQRSMSQNLRHDVERRFRRLCDAGVVSVQISNGHDQLGESLEEAFRVEKLSWKGKRGTAIASRKETSRFYAELAQWAASRDWLRLAFLRLDGRPIAFQFDLEVRPTYYSLKIGYDPEFERFSPGKLLAYTMVSRAVALGLTGYELLGTDEAWKHRWTQDVREHVTLRAFARSPAGVLAWSAAAYVGPLARRVLLATRAAAALRR